VVTSVELQLRRIDARFSADPDGFIENTEELTLEEYAFVGQLIQLYYFADFCARRIIDAVREAAFGPEKRNASKLMEKEVFPALEKATKLLWDGNVKANILKAAETIGMHRHARHNFAHWACRRVPGEDVWIMLSKDAREGKRRDGRDRDSYQTSYGFVELSSLRTEMEKLNAHTHNLSVYAYQLETRIDQVRKGIKSGKAP
jgi:hypothetical protein